MTASPLTQRILDADIQRLIQSRARRLHRGFRRPACDREDLVQELTLALYRRLPNYDPQRCSFHCFAMIVLDRTARTIIKRHTAACRKDFDTLSFGELERKLVFGAAEGMVVDPSGPSAEEFDLRLDLAEALSELPPELQQAAELLMVRSATEAERSMGVSRCRFRILMKRLREALDRRFGK